MDQKQPVICGSQATGSPASLPPLKPAAFNSSSMFCQINNKLGSIHSLDILASNVEVLRCADNHWVVPLTLFHYITKGVTHSWSSDHAIILTIADLFCDEVPEHLRSTDAIANLAESARDYISKMAVYHHQWSTITMDDYKDALKNNPTWPTIENPHLDSTGSTVLIDKLIEAWVFCFKHPINSAAIRINPGILSLLFCCASHGKKLASNVIFVNGISTAMGCIEKVNEDLMKSIVGNLIPIVSIDNLQSLYKNFVNSVPAFNIRIRRIMSTLVIDRFHHFFTVLKAMEDFKQFRWKFLGDLLPSELNAFNEARLLIRKSRYFGLMHNTNAASSEGFKTFAYAARELYVQLGSQSIDSDYPTVNQRMTLIIKNLIDDYLKERLLK